MSLSQAVALLMSPSPSLPPSLSLCTQAGYWSSRKYEVHGAVYNSEGAKVKSLFGTWNEAMFCGELENPLCVWRIGRQLPHV